MLPIQFLLVGTEGSERSRSDPLLLWHGVVPLRDVGSEEVEDSGERRYENVLDVVLMVESKMTVESEPVSRRLRDASRRRGRALTDLRGNPQAVELFYTEVLLELPRR